MFAKELNSLVQDMVISPSSCNALQPPWIEVAVNLIGPWSIQHYLHDFVFRFSHPPILFQIQLRLFILKQTSTHSMFFEKNCFTKYPSPYWCFHVIGGEFTGITLLQGFKISGIKDVTPTIKNQQGYDICDRFSSTNQRQFKLYYTFSSTTKFSTGQCYHGYMFCCCSIHI